MILRPNKAMPRSPEIEKAIQHAFKNLEVGETEELLIPWSAFVFSTREGKTYLPPTFAEGIKSFQQGCGTRSWMAGVPLVVRLRAPQTGGYMRFGSPWRFGISEIASDRDASTLAHEVMHFVQEVGDRVLRNGMGGTNVADVQELSAKGWERIETHRGEWVAVQRRRPIDTFTYGMPKKRSLTRHYRPAGAPGPHDAWQEKDYREHALRDIEFATNALSLGIDVATSAPVFGPNLHPEGTLARSLIRKRDVETRGTGDFTRTRLRDFTRAAFEHAIQHHNETWRTRLSPALTPKIRKILGLPVPSEERLPRRDVPIVPAEVVEVSTGLRVVHESLNGRPAYVIYRGGVSTGKYAFSEAKAKEIMGRMRA